MTDTKQIALPLTEFERVLRVCACVCVMMIDCLLANAHSSLVNEYRIHKACTKIKFWESDHAYEFKYMHTDMSPQQTTYKPLKH